MREKKLSLYINMPTIEFAFKSFIILHNVFWAIKSSSESKNGHGESS